MYMGKDSYLSTMYLQVDWANAPCETKATYLPRVCYLALD